MNKLPAKPDASGRRLLLAILILCLVIRIGIAVHERHRPLVSDAAMYSQIADSLINGHGFSVHFSCFAPGELRSTAHRDPLYIFFLAAVKMVCGPNVLFILILQALMSTATCYLVYLSASRFARHRLVPPLAAVLFTLYLPVALSVGQVLTETLAVFLVAAAVYAFAIGMRYGPLVCVGAGVLFGLAILTRGSLLFMPVLLALLMLRMRAEIAAWLPKAAAFVAVSYLVVAPWTIRNYVVMHGFVPVSAYGWQILWAGTGPADGHILAYSGAPVETGPVNHHDPHKPYVSKATYDYITALQEAGRRLSEVQAESLFRKEAFRQIEQHPLRYVSLMPTKFVRLWGNVLFENPPSKLSIALALGNLVILVLAAIGCVKGGVDRMFRGASMLLVGYITCIGIFIFACVRFTYALMPMLLILAAVGIVSLVGGKPGAAEVAEPRTPAASKKRMA